MARSIFRTLGEGFSFARGPRQSISGQGKPTSESILLGRNGSEEHNHDVLGINPIPISRDLKRVIQDVHRFLESSQDVSTRNFSAEGTQMTLIYIDGLVDKPSLQKGILVPLMSELREARKAGLKGKLKPQCLAEKILPIHEVKPLKTVQEIVLSVLDGESVLIGEGWNTALSLDTRGWEKRAIEEPETESVLRGPREGFVEDLVTNISLIRRRFHHPKLTIVFRRIGRLSRTRVAFLYVQGLVRKEVLEELSRRLGHVGIDAVLGAGYIEELIEDSPWSPFPQVGTTERPDRAIAAMLQGKVIILTDGTPFVLSVPVNASSFLDNPEDYYHRWMGGSIARLTRYVSVFISLILAPLYVAFTTFHQELIPRPLAISIAIQREMVPYPAIIEALIMLLVFEVLTEASARMPKNMGPTIGIVGALVIGEAAVRASLISNVMVIIIALTALAQFVLMYPVTTALRILRIGLLIAGSVLGLYGIFWALTLILLHLTSLRSFGVPYFMPFSPLVSSDLKDTVARTPIWAQVKRPRILVTENQKRMKKDMKKNQMDLGRNSDGTRDWSQRKELETVLDSAMEENLGTEDGSRSRPRGPKPSGFETSGHKALRPKFSRQKVRGFMRDVFRRLFGCKALAIFFLAAVFGAFAAGCWDRREINQLAIVSSVAVDKIGDEVVLTVEIFRPPAGSASQGFGGGGIGVPGLRSVVLAEGRGPTFFSAIRDMARKVPRRVYWAQAVACVVGEEVAKESIIEVLDIWDREMELRRTAFFLVAEGRARDILTETLGELETTFAEEIDLLSRTSKFSGYTLVSNFHDMISGLARDTHTAVTGVLALKPVDQPPIPRSPMPGEKEPLKPSVARMVQLSGVAVFKESKLQAIVPISPEARGIVAGIGRLQSTALDLTCPCKYLSPNESASQGGAQGEPADPKKPSERERPAKDLISLKVTSAKVKYEVGLRDPKDIRTIRAKINIEVEANLSSQKCSTDLTRPKMIQAIREEAAKAIKQEMEKSVQLMQEISTDPYGLGQAFHRKEPRKWHQVKTRWDQVFKDMPIEVTVEVRLRHTGDTRTPPGRCY